MVELKELEWKKRDELYQGITRLKIPYDEAKKVFTYFEDECLIEIYPPQREEDFMQMVSIKATHTGRYRGKSYKPGNIILNIKDAAVSAIASGASSTAAIGAVSASQPIVAFFTILAAVLSAAEMGKVVLDENAVLILAVLWENRHIYGGTIDVKEGLGLVNKHLESYHREEMPEMQYQDLLEDLAVARCIALGNGKIELIEKIQISY